MAFPVPSEALLLVWAFTGMALLGMGVFWQGERRHHLRIAGWLVFGFYWPFKAPHYFEIGDPFNAWFALLAPLLTGYVAYHEYRSWTWKEDPVALRWLSGATFIAAMTYFLLFEIKPIQESIIYSTGGQSSWLADTLFGTNSVAVQDIEVSLKDGYRRTHICLDQPYGDPIPSTFCSVGNAGTAVAGFPYYAVTIIFACTALQSIMIFVGAIAFTRAPSSKKWKAYAVTVPTIYLLNIFRNAGIVYGYRVKHYSMFGMDSFEFMHSAVAKTGSVIALIVIALAVFRLLPQLHENILEVLALPKRKRAEPPRPPSDAPAEAS